MIQRRTEPHPSNTYFPRSERVHHGGVPSAAYLKRSLMASNDTTRTCPYCREEIKPEAIKCKHCGSSLAADKPSHKGTCPFCKEDIHAEAIKCKHCGSSLLASKSSGCGCEQGSSGGQVSSRLLSSPGEDPASFGLGPSVITKLASPLNEGGKSTCIRRFRCTQAPWGWHCWAEMCCFSSETGSWGCVGM